MADTAITMLDVCLCQSLNKNLAAARPNVIPVHWCCWMFKEKLHIIPNTDIGRCCQLGDCDGFCGVRVV